MIAALTALAGLLVGFALGWRVHDLIIRRILEHEKDEHARPFWPGID